jgi:hypothetical protein
LSRMSKVCQADIAKENHQVWYNKEEMDAAILKIEGTKQTTYLYVGDRWHQRQHPSPPYCTILGGFP